MIDLNEVGAHVAFPAGQDATARFGVYLPGITKCGCTASWANSVRDLRCLDSRGSVFYFDEQSHRDHGVIAFHRHADAEAANCSRTCWC